jgi:archaellum component FlaC
VLRLTDDMQTVKGNIKALEKRDEEILSAINRLTHRIDRLEEKYDMEQEILLLKLENRLLRDLKGLPPAPPQSLPDDSKDQ